MKNLILFFLILFFGSSQAHAQDVIVKKSGDELRVKIQEINTQDIIFIYPDSANKQLFFIPKAEVFMIKHASGRKEMMDAAVGRSGANNNNRIERVGSRYYVNGALLSERSVSEIIRESKNESAISEMEQATAARSFGKGLVILGIPVGSIGLPVALLGLVLRTDSYSSPGAQQTSNTLLLTGIAGITFGLTAIIVGTVTMSQHTDHIQRAVDLYNKEIK